MPDSSSSGICSIIEVSRDDMKNVSPFSSYAVVTEGISGLFDSARSIAVGEYFHLHDCAHAPWLASLPVK